MNDLKVAQVNEGQEMPEPSWHISRRGFLIGMAITGTAFALGIPLGLPVARRKIAEFMAGDFAIPSSDLNPLLWLSAAQRPHPPVCAKSGNGPGHSHGTCPTRG